MSPKHPTYTAKEVVQLLQEAGFVLASQKGSHAKYFHPQTRRIAIVPMHGKRQIPIGTLKSIEKQSGLTF